MQEGKHSECQDAACGSNLLQSSGRGAVARGKAKDFRDQRALVEKELGDWIDAAGVYFKEEGRSAAGSQEYGSRGFAEERTVALFPLSTKSIKRLRKSSCGMKLPLLVQWNLAVSEQH